MLTVLLREHLISRYADELLTLYTHSLRFKMDEMKPPTAEVDHSKEESSDTMASPDLEMNGTQTGYLANDFVKSFAWKDLQVTVKGRKTKAPLSILSEAAGIVEAGEMLAIMGPSGSGKTTLLNALAHRVAAAGATTTGNIFANGQKLSLQLVRDLSGYVEQEDALIGSLTVRETMIFAAQLALPRYFFPDFCIL